jgi:hypothetical protein
VVLDDVLTHAQLTFAFEIAERAVEEKFLVVQIRLGRVGIVVNFDHFRFRREAHFRFAISARFRFGVTAFSQTELFFDFRSYNFDFRS